MKDIKETLQKLHIVVQMQPIRDGVNKEDMIFSKNPSDTRHGTCGQTTSTVQCPGSWKHVPEGMLQCLCGNWLKPDEHTVNPVKLKFAELVKPYYSVLPNKSRGR